MVGREMPSRVPDELLQWRVQFLQDVAKVVMPLPGGCTIGKRPIDLHLSDSALGATVTEDQRILEYHNRSTERRSCSDAIYLIFLVLVRQNNFQMAAACQGPTSF